MDFNLRFRDNGFETTTLLSFYVFQVVPLLKITTYDRDVNSLPVSAPDAVTCYILPSVGAEFFALSDCEIFFAKDVVDLDSHLEFRTLNLTIMVNDTFGYSDTATVIIDVQDENDNAPDFTSNAYSATIPGTLSTSRLHLQYLLIKFCLVFPQ